MAVTASAPAKIILFGEHFVVYGKPAVVTAIDKRARVTAELRADHSIYINSVNLDMSGFFVKKRFKAEHGGLEAHAKLEPVNIATQQVLSLLKKTAGVSLTIHSSIPVAAGLGSSAAVAVATSAAVGHLLGAKLSQETIFRMAFEAERSVHGTPSGIDPAISTFGGVLLFEKDKGFTPIETKRDIQLVVGDTGIHRSTGMLIDRVRERRALFPSIINPLMEAGERITLTSLDALKKGDLSTLGELMNINHEILSALGVSNETLDKLVCAARKAKSLGAKLTGAGGGGCMFALAYPNDIKQVVDALKREGATVFVTRKTAEGVKIEG